MARKKRVRKMKRRNPIRRRKSAKRVAAGKKAARTRKRRKNARKANPVKRRRVIRRRRRKNSWPEQPIRHKRASHKGWGRRRRAKKGYAKPKTYMRKGVKQFARWRNQGKEFWISAGVAALGGVLATILVAQASKKMQEMQDSVPDSVPDNVVKYAPAIIPVGAAFLLAKFAVPKVSAKNKNLVNGLSLGLAIAGMLAAASIILPPDLKAKIGMGGYVRSMKGYTNTPFLASYAPSRRYAPNGLSGIKNRRNVVPYGLGLPLETRQYNNFNWQGVLSKSVFE